MMTFLLFAPANTKWLTENPKGTAQVDFVTFIVHSNIEDFQTRIIELTSRENSQATYRSYDFCMT